MMYRVTGQILTHDGEWSGSVSVPTFMLDSDAQGFFDEEGAEIVARCVVNPLGRIPSDDIKLCILPAYAPETTELDQVAEHYAGRHAAR
jgi:hypothetical protein